jgi:hypothetical protein
MRDYGDNRFGRLLIYLLAYDVQAEDWDDRSIRIGFDSGTLLAGFTPQFHHIFPKAFIGDQHPDTLVNALANIALIGPAINIRISKKDPMDYVQRYGISDLKLEQQNVDADLRLTPIDAFPAWVARRAEKLANAGNAFLARLRGNLAFPETAPAATAEHAFSSE